MFRSMSSGLLHILFSAEGRIGRGDYWLWSILVNLVVFAFQHYVFGFWSFTPMFLDVLILDGAWLPGDVAIMHMVLFLLTLWPILCLNAKRWHDRGKSGWLAGVVMALGVACYALRWVYPDYGYYGGYGYDYDVIQRLLPLVYGAFLLWTFIECGLMPGQPRDNRYGPPSGYYREEAYY